MAHSTIHSSSYPRNVIRGPHVANNATLWDRIVFVAFCGSLLLFLHALAGYGTLEERAVSTNLLQPGLSCSRQVNQDRRRVLPADSDDHMPGSVVKNCEDGLAMDRALSGINGYSSAMPGRGVLAPTPAATYRESPYDRSQPPKVLKPQLNLLHPLYDPFDFEPLIGADEYDEMDSHLHPRLALT